MTIKLSAKRPDEDLNGIIDISDQLYDHPQQPIVAVVLLKNLRDGREHERDSDGKVITVRFIHVEPLDGEAAETARKLLNEARADRIGSDQLPMERAVYADDEHTGQIRKVTAPEQAGAVAERVKDEWLDDGKER